MSFSWLNKQGVESSEGFAVQRVSRFVVEYRSGEKTMQLEGESLIIGNLESGIFGFGFYSKWRTTKWDSPYDGEPISSEERDQIVSNISRAMKFMGGEAKFR